MKHKKIIILGDFNAHIGQSEFRRVEDPKRDDRGKVLEWGLQDANMRIITLHWRIDNVQTEECN